MNKHRHLNFWGDMLESLIIGIIVGGVVGAYQLVLQYAVKGSKYMYSSREPWIIVAMAVIVGVLALANHFIVKKHKGVAGSGVPYMEKCIHRDHEINWKQELPLMIFNSLASGFVGFPLGGEGPSVVMGGKIAQMVEDVGNVGEEDTVVMAFGTGFGCAVLSPLAGICYIFEEALKRFNIKYFFRGILMMVSAYLVTSLINDHRMLAVDNVVILPFENYYVFVLLIVVNVLLGVLFVKGLVGAKRLAEKYANSFVVKNLGFFLFALVFALNFLCFNWMGSGASIVENVANFQSLWLVLGVIAFRLVLTIFCGTDRVTGGLVVPTLALGALGGQLVCLICNDYFGMPNACNGVVILISVCIIFSVVNKTPITASVLFFSALGYSAGDYLSIWQIIPMTVVAIILATWASKLFVKDSLYHLLVSVDDEFYPASAQQTEQPDCQTSATAQKT